MALADHDPLLLLRQAISSGSILLPRASGEPGAEAEAPLSRASHLHFSGQDSTLGFETATRFISNDKPVDLRSIYFAWLNRELAIPEYNASATTLNEELAAAGSTGRVQNLGFIERLDLITWLEGASEESEYIKPLAGEAEAAAAGAVPTSKAGAASSASRARSGKGIVDSRLATTHDGERRMGDRNTVLRGNKPTVSPLFSVVFFFFFFSSPLLIRDSRTSPTCDAWRRLSSRENPSRRQQPSAPILLSALRKRARLGDRTPSSCYRRRHPPSCACPTRAPFSRRASLCRPMPQPRAQACSTSSG